MDTTNFMHISHVFKIITIIQIVIFCILFLTTLFFKIYHNIYILRQKKTSSKIKQQLLKFNSLAIKDLEFLKRNRKLSFETYYLLEKQDELPGNQRNQDILNFLFLPFLEKDVLSKSWPARNNAALSLQLKNKYFKTLSNEDEHHLSILLNDFIPLVSINAAIAVCYHPTKDNMNVLIDVFSKSRRFQYDLFTEILQTAALVTVPLIYERLKNEENVYVRVFCYRMLRQLPKIELTLPKLTSDLNSANIDLSLASLAYMAYAQKSNYEKYLLKGLQSKYWEVRARCAKLLGYTQNEALTDFILPLLTDKEWWVRFRAAEALCSMGQKGLDILKLQTDIDLVAYEIAQEQLGYFKLRRK